ncbi:sialate O-acetylesterase [Polaribacter aquimarinus]|uniref:Sialate O-acetylesterase n=1 Tax=Polaribacter aquimarinus TaxID=2100726 RepID=A0A2U2JEI7_9FLAO|nr:sialate O-acetylesterase [Polaribacter aquimarinus]PWG06749.1 sialate O-acetylesterase [Polaribacter aquimarinus]
MKWVNKYFLSILLISVSLQAQTKVSSVFSDHMVLQQKETISIWGKDKPNTTVYISTSWKYFTKTTSNKEGVWEAKLKTKKASFNPKQITIQGSSKITLKNVLIGEVWFCSGQSNMEMALQGLRKSKVLNAQKYINIADNKNIRLFNVPRTASVLPSLDVDAKWQESSVKSAKSFSAVGYIFAVELYEKLKVPIGIIEASWGGTRIESWIPKKDLIKYNGIRFFDELPKEQKKQKKPSFLYNGMIHPFKDFTVKGLLWYQGESNRTQPNAYKKYMEDLITSWRMQWKNKKLPFYFVQIAPYDYAKHKRGTSLRPNLIRETQLEISQEVKNTGLVVTTDAGDCNDIHPSKKEVIAKRFSNWALSKQYNFKNRFFKSIELKSFKIKNNQIKLKFKHYNKDQFISSNKIKGFVIAGSDKVFYPADVIIDKKGKHIFLSNKNVKKPVAVRYGFEACFESNLKTKSGLPISVFRTDRW